MPLANYRRIDFRHLADFLPGLVLLLAVLCWSLRPGTADAAMTLATESGVEQITGHWALLRDPSGTMGVDDVIQADRAGAFKPIPGDLTAGYTTDALWLRLDLIRRADSDPIWWLELDPPFLDQVALYLPATEGAAPHLAGRSLPLQVRDLASNYLLFRLRLPPDQTTTVYIRLASQTSLVVHGKLIPQHSVFAHIQSTQLIISILFGSILMISLTSFMFSLWLRGGAYLPFAAWTFVNGWLFTANTGLIQLFLPRYHLYAPLFHGACMGLSLGIAGWLGIHILETRTRHRLIHKFQILEILVGLALTPLPLFGRYDLVPTILNPLALVTMVVSGWALIDNVRHRVPSSLTYLCGVAITIFFTILVILRNMAILPNTDFISWGYILEAPFYMIIVSIGLANGVRRTEQLKNQAQAALLLASRLSEQHLSERVWQRTRDLEIEIAERSQTEKRLRDNERKFRTLVETAPFPLLVAAEPDGRILFANSLTEKLLTTPVGKKLNALFADAQDDLFAILRADELVSDVEIRDTSTDGAQRWLLLSGTRLDFQGRPSVMVCINDFTERKMIELNLRDARVQAEAALAAQRIAMTEQRDFLAMVSHEFRNPLGIITASTEFIELDLQDDNEQGRQELQKIRRACQRMLKLVESCLSEEWLEAISLGRTLAPLNIARLLEEAGENVAAQSNPLTFNFPDSPSSLYVKGDLSLLSLMFGNLIDNAGKYTIGQAPIEISLTPCDGTAIITIADRGPGIPAGERLRIFDKYYRLPSTQTKPGAGLGLYLVRRILDMHFGTIEAAPRDGGGTVFTVNLPLCVPAEIEYLTERI